MEILVLIKKNNKKIPMKQFLWQKTELFKAHYLIGTNDNILRTSLKTTPKAFTDFCKCKINYQSHIWSLNFSFYEYDSAQGFLPECVTF